MSEAAIPMVGMSLPRRIVGVFFSPRVVFEELKERPRVLGALVVLCVVTLLVMLPVLNIVIQDQSAALQGKPNMSEDAMAKAVSAMKITIPLGAAFFTAVMTAVLAAFYLFLANILLGGATNFKRMMAAMSHIGMVNILGSLIRIPLMLARGTSHVSLSPAVFLPEEAQKTFLFNLLSQLDVFSIWMIGLSILAIAVMAGVPTRKASVAVIVLWVVLIPIFALLATKFGGGRA
jgi:Yip1-like protein